MNVASSNRFKETDLVHAHTPPVGTMGDALELIFLWTVGCVGVPLLTARAFGKAPPVGGVGPLRAVVLGLWPRGSRRTSLSQHSKAFKSIQASMFAAQATRGIAVIGPKVGILVCAIARVSNSSPSPPPAPYPPALRRASVRTACGTYRISALHKRACELPACTAL
jgi:hypothetical protein